MPPGPKPPENFPPRVPVNAGGPPPPNKWSLAEIEALLGDSRELLQQVKELRAQLTGCRKDTARVVERLAAVDEMGSPAAKKLGRQAALAQASSALAEVVALRQGLLEIKKKLEERWVKDLPNAKQQQLSEALAEEIRDVGALEDRLSELELQSQTGLDKAAGKQKSSGSTKDSEQPTAQAEALNHEGALPNEPSEAAKKRLEPVVEELSRLLAEAQKAKDVAASTPKDKDVARLQSTFADAVEDEPSRIVYGDPNEMAQWVLRQSYEDNTHEMRRFAMRTQFHTHLRDQVRKEAQRARRFLSEHARPDGADVAFEVPYDAKQFSKEPRIAPDGSWHLRRPEDAQPIASQADLQRYVADMEQLSLSVGDDMQVTQIELQASMQRQQQVMNALSSISKALHETAMAILRKIGS